MSSRNGFTLIELLVVISIIAVLAGLLIPGIGMVKNSSYKQHAQQTCTALSSAAAAYRLEDPRRLLPDEDPTLHALAFYNPNANSPPSFGLLNHLESRGLLISPPDLRPATIEERDLAGLPAALKNEPELRVLVDRWRRPMRYILDCWHANRPADLREEAPPAPPDGNALAATKPTLSGLLYIPTSSLAAWNSRPGRPFAYFYSAGSIKSDSDHLAANAGNWIHAVEGK